jgi:protein SCO1/2
MPFKSRYPLILLAMIVALVALLAYAGGRSPKSGVPSSTGSGGPLVGDFRLTDQNGRPFGKPDLLGKPSALFFGFTFCPDVCPTMLASMTAHMSKLGADADRLNVVFVSVDPERDTTEVIKAYLSSFDSRIRGLTGEKSQLDLLTKSLGIFYAKVDTGGASYSVDHSALIVLLDSHGQFFGTIAYDESPDVALMKLKRVVSEGYR